MNETASSIEIKRWVTESKMITKDYPVFAVLEDENKCFTICGVTYDGEKMYLRLKSKHKNV